MKPERQVATKSCRTLKAMTKSSELILREREALGRVKQGNSIVRCMFFFFNYLLIYLFLAVLGLRFCARAFSSCGKRGPLFIAASLVAEHRLQTRRLSSCGSRA